MKKRIYNKKKFWSGIVFLILAAINISFTITRFNNLNTSRIIKFIVLNTFCILFGVTEVYRSLSSKCTKEDDQNDDERENLINMKSKSKAFDIIFLICSVIIILSSIALVLTKNNFWVGAFVCIGIMFTIMIIVGLSSYFYYDKRN